MVSESDTGQCVSKDAEPRRGVDNGQCATEDAEHRRGWTAGGVPKRTLSPEGGWIVRSHIGWRGERSILYKGVETSP